jgi:amidase
VPRSSTSTFPNFDTISKRVGCGDFQADLNKYFSVHGTNAVYDSGLYLANVGDRIKRSLDPKSNPNARPGPCVDTYHDEKKIVFRNAILAAMNAAKIDPIIYPTGAILRAW